MPGRRRRTADASNDNATRVELGPFRLYWREEREVWTIAWYDDGGGSRTRRICRKTTGIGVRGEDGRPPQEALDALADHYTEWRKPTEQAANEALVEGLLADWLEHVEEADADPQRAKDCVAQWLAFFEMERREGRITRGPYVSDIGVRICERFIKWRLAQPGKRRGTTISGGTVSRELAALRAALRRAWKAEQIPSAPYIPDVEKADKAQPRELIYTPEEVARILEAAWRLEERRHVHLFILIMLSTHGRGEAVLELDASRRQLRHGLIYFLAPGEVQTKKRRSIVPVAPTLAPWLEGIDGKVIQYRTRRKDDASGEEEIITKPTASIKTAFAACLIEAGLCQQEVDDDGKPVWLLPRRKLGETQARPSMVPIGNPNTLRHTIATELHALGVPEAQIDTAAGHAGTGTNKKNYRHLRPDYLKEFIEGVEAYWRRVGQFTDVHIHPSHRFERSARKVGRHA